MVSKVPDSLVITIIVQNMGFKYGFFSAVTMPAMSLPALPFLRTFITASAPSNVVNPIVNHPQNHNFYGCYELSPNGGFIIEFTTWVRNGSRSFSRRLFSGWGWNLSPSCSVSWRMRIGQHEVCLETHGGFHSHGGTLEYMVYNGTSY